MTRPAVRFGGGVWKHQEDIRADLQRRLDESEDKLQHALAEVDRVHAQCVVLLRDKNELSVSLAEAHAQLRRQGDELHAARQNVTELMALLTQANEARSALERERTSVTQQWHNTRELAEAAQRDADALRAKCEEDEQEARRLRDLLYAAQEQNECQLQELTRHKRHLEVAVRSNEAKDRQVLALIRERDLFAQKLAHYRSRFMDGKSLPSARKPAPPQSQPAKSAGSNVEDSCENVTWTEISPERATESPPPSVSSPTLYVLEFERQKQKLRGVALQTKARLEKERAQNAALHERIGALEKSQQELLVRYREASKAARRRPCVSGVAASVISKSVVVHADESPEETTESPVQAA